MAACHVAAVQRAPLMEITVRHIRPFFLACGDEVAVLLAGDHAGTLPLALIVVDDARVSLAIDDGAGDPWAGNEVSADLPCRQHVTVHKYERTSC